MILASTCPHGCALTTGGYACAVCNPPSRWTFNGVPVTLNTNAEVERLRADLAAVKARVEEMARALGFFASVIKSGETWSPTCEEVLRSAVSVTPPVLP